MRKVLLLLMALVLPMVASASSELISGQCGDNATFVLDRYGTLTISGTGAMSGKKPWTSYSTCLTRVIVEEGITSINSSAFYGCSAISYVSLPSTLTTIGSYAFERGLKYGAAIVCSAVAPPTVGEDWIDASRFSGVTLYVPETALETYKTTSPWSQFSKILTFQPSVGLLAGSCGENVSFVLGIDGTLTISGTGWMSGYTSEDTQPWKDFRSFISNVVIGDGVTNIGYNAFYGCHCLSVTIGSAVTGIESRAFYNCHQLCSITCKATDLSSMGSDIFRNVPKDNIVLYVPAALIENAASWWSGLFRIKAIEQPDVIAGLCGEALAYELSSEGTLYIHGATSSYDYTLATQPWADYRGQIKRIELSSHVYSLGAHLFNSCTALKTVVCPVTARTVLGTGTGTFDNVPLSSATLYVLASVLDDYKADDVWKNFGAILPIGSDYIDGIYYSLDNIDNKATVIAGTNKYTGNIVIPSTVSSQGTTYTVTKVASGAFADCVGMTSITIPATVLEMGKGAFSGCTGLTKVYFSSLPHLCSITFGDGGNPLGKAHHLYINGSEVTNVVIPNGVTSIGNYAFDGGSYITSVSIPASVTSIGLAIFEDCDQLSSITVAQGNTAYDSRNNCNAIINKAYNMVWAGCKNTVIPTDVTAVGPYSFYHNGGLTSINIPDNITKIYEGAFEGCSNLQSVTIGAGMQEIERYAFNACSSIKTFYCNATTPPTTGEDVFGGVSTAAATLYVPAAALDPYKAAAPWKNFGTILPMGDTPSLYIETDVTGQFPTDWQGWNGATGYTPAEYAPKVTTNDGRTVQVCEKFTNIRAELGTVFTRTLTGLANGTYRIELYGAASSTKGRDGGIDTNMTASDEGDETAVYLYAKTASGTVKQYIPVHWATSFSEVATAVLDDVVVTDGTVEIGMVSEKKFTNWHVVQIKGVTALVDATELHANALANARKALSDAAYVNVVGSERTVLTQAIASYSVVSEQTAEAYQKAANALSTATWPFVEAKDNYDVWAEFKSRSYPYASETVKAAVEAAAAVLPANAADALNRIEAMKPLYRQYAESSAMLEGLEGATDRTSYIKNPYSDEGLDGWTIVRGGGSGGSISIRDDQSWIDGSGSNDHRYFDGGYWEESDWDLALQQEISIPAGRYQLTALGRSSGDVALTLYAGNETAEMAHTATEGGLFTLGWEQTSVEFELTENATVSIGVRGVCHVLYNWMSFSEFRLVQFPNSTDLLYGKCGEDLDYVLTKDYNLQISGTGTMYDYSDSNKAPWNSYSGFIQTVEIGSKVTGIGKRAFRDCTGLTSIVIPSNVTSIGQDAFSGCQFRTIVSKAVHPSDYSLEDAGFSMQEFNHTVLYVPENAYWDYVFNSDWYRFYHIKEYAATEVQTHQAYMLAEADGTNYMVYNSSRDALEVKGYAHQLDEASPGCSWVAEAYGSGYALLNLGAEKYADIDAEGRISLSDRPRALNIEFHDGSATVNGHALMMVINDNDVVTEVVNLRYTSSAEGKSHDVNTPIYDLSGRQLSKKPAKGYYIRDGKKFYVK